MAASLTGARYLRDAIVADSAEITGSATIGGSVTVLSGISGDGSKLTGIASPVTVNTSIEINGIASRLTNQWVVTHGNLLSNANFNGVAWSPTLNLFVAVGNGGTVSPPDNSIYSSPDGLTWTPRNVGSYTEWYGITWGGSKFVAVGDNGGNAAVASSSDGVNWTISLTTTGPGATLGMLAVCYSPALSRYVAVGYKLSSYSTDGVNWTIISTTPVATYNWVAVVWADTLGLYVVVGALGRVMTSPDGITWTLTAATLGSSFGVNSLAWSSLLGMLVTFSHVCTSKDGVNWTQYGTSRQALPAMGAIASCWVPDDGGYFVCLTSTQIGTNQSAGAVSSDGQTWVPFFDPNAASVMLNVGIGGLAYSSSLKRLVYVSTNTGAVTLGGSVSNITYVSNTSGFAGVGTSTPAQALDVAGYVRTQQPFFVTKGTESVPVGGSNMSFANVLVNVGSGYSTGYYTCVGSGVHSFTACANIPPGTSLCLDKIGSPYLTLGMSSNNGNGFVYVSVSATTPLQLMEQVFVKCLGGSGQCDTGSTFSGAMLFAT